MHSCMQGWGSMDGVWDGSFLEWVGRSQLYSADLLSPDAAKDLEQWMQCAAPADKRHMMALLRDLHATVTPTGYRAPAHLHFCIGQGHTGCLICMLLSVSLCKMLLDMHDSVTLVESYVFCRN